MYLDWEYILAQILIRVGTALTCFLGVFWGEKNKTWEETPICWLFFSGEKTTKPQEGFATGAEVLLFSRLWHLGPNECFSGWTVFNNLPYQRTPKIAMHLDTPVFSLLGVSRKKTIKTRKTTHLFWNRTHTLNNHFKPKHKLDFSPLFFVFGKIRLWIKCPVDMGVGRSDSRMCFLVV